MAPDVIEGLRNPNRHALKKGPWTTSEDLLLLEYVRKHGEGNWNAVQRNSGLLRCGKSCRLRWANHLRPHLKKGAFSPDEERLIVELHAKMGNKWARMASQLPGRTDNEIKNYWNTRLKRRQRAGLPIYPHEVVEQEQRQRQIASASLYHRHNQNPVIAFAPPPPPAENIPANHQLKLYHDGITLALDAAASSSSLYSSSTFFNQLPPMMNSLSFNQFTFAGGAHGIGGLGLPSIQSPPATAAVTPAASSSDFAAAEEEFEAERGSRSGLLEDLFGESRALVAGNYGNNMHEEEEEEENNFGFSHGGSSSHGSYEGVEGKSLEEGMTSMDDELMNLLDNFPLSVPIPDWNGEEGSESPNLTNGTSSMMHSPSMASEYNPVAASSGSPNQEWNFGSCLWNNMRSIY